MMTSERYKNMKFYLSTFIIFLSQISIAQSFESPRIQIEDAYFSDISADLEYEKVYDLERNNIKNSSLYFNVDKSTLFACTKEVAESRRTPDIPLDVKRVGLLEIFDRRTVLVTQSYRSENYTINNTFRYKMWKPVIPNYHDQMSCFTIQLFKETSVSETLVSELLNRSIDARNNLSDSGKEVYNSALITKLGHQEANQILMNFEEKTRGQVQVEVSTDGDKYRQLDPQSDLIREAGLDSNEIANLMSVRNYEQLGRQLNLKIVDYGVSENLIAIKLKRTTKD